MFFVHVPIQNVGRLFGVVRSYRPSIREPAPSLSQHGVPIGGIQVFPVIKIILIHQVHTYCSLSAK